MCVFLRVTEGGIERKRGREKREREREGGEDRRGRKK